MTWNHIQTLEHKGKPVYIYDKKLAAGKRMYKAMWGTKEYEGLSPSDVVRELRKDNE